MDSIAVDTGVDRAGAEGEAMSEQTLWAGLDPGRTGGIAVIGKDSVATCALAKHSETEIADFLRQYASRISFATIEKVWMRPGDSPHVGILVQSYGCLRGLLAAFDIPRTEATPQKWQSKLGVPGDDKPALRQYMSQRYPGTRWTDAVSAAGCLAEYTRLTHTRIAIDNQRNGGRDHRWLQAGSVFAGDRDGAEISETAKALREFNET